MSNPETARKMGKLYTETLKENQILLKRLKDVEQINLELRKKMVHLIEENALLSESVKSMKEILRKLKP